MAASKVEVSVIVTTCDLCETSKMVYWQCEECEETICERCKNIHLKGKATRDHVIKQVSEKESGDTVTLTSFTLTDIQHPENNPIVSVSPFSRETAWIGRETKDSLTLYSADGTVIQQKNFPAWIASVAAGNQGEIIVTIPSNGNIDVMSPKFEIKTLTTLNKLQPWGVCMTRAGFTLVGVVDANDVKTYPGSVRLLYKLNKAGIVVETYGHSEESSLFTIPRIVKENINLDLVVVDKFGEEKAQIIVFDHYGKLRFKYNGQTAKDDKPFEASDVTFDSNCRMVVPDRANKNIHILDQDGNFIQFLETGITDLVPRSVSFGFDRALWPLWIGYEKSNVATLRYLL